MGRYPNPDLDVCTTGPDPAAPFVYLPEFVLPYCRVARLEDVPEQQPRGARQPGAGAPPGRRGGGRRAGAAGGRGGGDAPGAGGQRGAGGGGGGQAAPPRHPAGPPPPRTRAGRGGGGRGGGGSVRQEERLPLQLGGGSSFRASPRHLQRPPAHPPRHRVLPARPRPPRPLHHPAGGQLHGGVGDALGGHGEGPGGGGGGPPAAAGAAAAGL